MTLTNKRCYLLPTVGLLALAGCGSSGGDTDESTTESAPATSDETGEPTTGTTADTAGSTTGTDVAETTADATGTSTDTGDDTTGTPGETTAAETTTDGETTSAPVGEPEIAGAYTDEYGSMHLIDAATWTLDTSVFHILAFDNDADYLVAGNDPANEFFPDLFSRFDWSIDGDAVHYCQTAYDAPDQQTAESTPPADPGDLTTGCGGFPWTLLTP